MKNFASILLILLFSITAAKAQFTKLGGGPGFTSGYLFHKMDYDYNKSGHLFVSAKGIYELSLPVHISPSITFFMPHVYKEFDQKTTVNTMMVDINGHYVFNSLDQFEFYGLAGIDIILAWKRDKYPNITYKESDNTLGLNLGLGTYMKLTEQFDLYAEAKYLLSKYSQFMLNAGILINIDWLSKHEETGM
jgi:hypothetical protein